MGRRRATLALLLLFSGHAASFAPTTRPRWSHRRPAIRVRVVDDSSVEEQVVVDGSLVELLVAEAEATALEVAELEAICARGVCAVPEVACDESDPMCTVEPGLTLEYLWPRLLLAFASILYGELVPPTPPLLPPLHDQCHHRAPPRPPPHTHTPPPPPHARTTTTRTHARTHHHHHHHHHPAPLPPLTQAPISRWATS